MIWFKTYLLWDFVRCLRCAKTLFLIGASVGQYAHCRHCGARDEIVKGKKE